MEGLVLSAPLLPCPIRPDSVMLHKEVSGEDPVTSSILDVDMKVTTFHGNHDVEVKLKRVRNALLNAKVLCFTPSKPGQKLGYGENGASGDESDRP